MDNKVYFLPIASERLLPEKPPMTCPMQLTTAMYEASSLLTSWGYSGERIFLKDGPVQP